MKSLNKYISEKLIINQRFDEKLIINKNYKNTNTELINIINLITDGEKIELKRNGMIWGYRLKHNADISKELLKEIEKNVKQKYASINVDVNKHLDEGLVVIVVSNIDNAIIFHKSVLDENRIIKLSIYQSNRKRITVEAAYDQGTHSSIEGWEIRNCYKMPIDDFITLFETIVNNDCAVGTDGPSNSDYNNIINHIK